MMTYTLLANIHHRARESELTHVVLEYLFGEVKLLHSILVDLHYGIATLRVELVAPQGEYVSLAI
jgi:hypothetical protein